MMNDAFKKSAAPKNIPKKSDILHKVQMGILFDVYYDTETTDLNKRFAEITQFGGVVTDLGGNFLQTVDFRAKVSPYTVISPFAWLVQRLRLEDVSKGEVRALFMGRVRRFFEQSSQLHLAPYRLQFLSQCQYGTYTDVEGKKVGYYSYPVMNDDGTIDHDFIRIHEKLKKFYFKDVATGQWVKRDIKALTIGYNNINSDDQWLWTAAHMAGIDNIFFTHLAQKGKFRIDMLRAVEAASVAGKNGENSLRVPVTVDKATGEKRYSYSLGSILAANTHLQSETRHILSGIEGVDGAQIDVTQLHGALADAIALCALTQYMRRGHPDILAQMERNTDWKTVIDKLNDVKGNFGNHPPLAYVDKNYPAVEGKFVSLIGTDQLRNAPKVAVVWNLAIDPQTYTFNGKNIASMEVSDWREVILDSPTNPNSPLKIIKAHKSPRLLDAETGYAAGFNLGLSRMDLHGRVQHLRRGKLEQKIMAALRLANPRLAGPERLVLPQPEEELFTFSTLELYDAEKGEDVQVNHRIFNKIEDVAQKSRAHIMKVKGLWLQAIAIDEDILLDGGNDPSSMIDKVKDINKQLAKIKGPLVPTPDSKITNQKEAWLYKIKILYFARNYFAQGVLEDIGHHFWFEDKEGIRYDDAQLKKWPSYKLDDAFRNGQLEICHEPTHTSVLIIDRMIEELGYADFLGTQLNEQLEAYKSLKTHGIPHYRGIGDRWYTIHAARRDLDKITSNQMTRSDLMAVEGYIPGAWSEFVDKHHDGYSSLVEYRQYLQQLEKREILQPSQFPLVGIDSKTGIPLQNYDFLVNVDSTPVINVPDRYIEQPTIDPIHSRAMWILPLKTSFNKASLPPSGDIIFKAQGTCRAFHMANARQVPLPPRGGVYEDFYVALHRAYETSGLKLPPYSELSALIGNGPYPLANWIEDAEATESLIIPKPYFEAFLSPRLVGRKKAPQGLIIKDDHLQLGTGIVYLREAIENGSSSGWQFQADIESVKEISLSDLNKMTIQEIEAYGFVSHEDAINYFTSLFTKFKKNPKQKKNTALAIGLSNIDPDDPVRGIMYFKPDTQGISYAVHAPKTNQPQEMKEFTP